MSPLLDASLRSWPSAPWLAGILLLSGAVYTRGWRVLRRRDPARWHPGRLAMFWIGQGTVYIALASPVEPFAKLLLSVHMVQHLLLMMIAPPLLWLSWPMLPLLLGLPKPIRIEWVGPMLRWRPIRRTFAMLVHPLVAWPLFTAAAWLWHTPRGYELGLAVPEWHIVQHLCFSAAALLFWYPVVLPYPGRRHWPSWIVFPYLLMADLQNTLLAAWLSFSTQPLYPYYTQVPRLNGLSALDDQQIAGVLMWVPGSIAFLLPLFWLGIRYFMYGEDSARRGVASTPRCDAREHLVEGAVASRQNAGRFDLLRMPIVGKVLRWRYARRVLQACTFAMAILIIYDGLFGLQVAPMNLAGVVPWIHWRGLLILSLLIVGNVFCYACPLTLPRAAVRHWFPRGSLWPRYFRNKWLAILLIIVFLWSYEAFALWDRPWLTAGIMIGFFVASFTVDSLFTDGTFCKYVCPVGQFNFVAATVSPLQVAVCNPTVCASCSTRECIRGNELVRGCEMHLFQPQKRGNLDCTFCLDCAHACPLDNVGIISARPSEARWSDRLRSGIGRPSRRYDIATLVVILVVGAFVNAVGMIEPVARWQGALRDDLGAVTKTVLVGVFDFFALILLPLAAFGGAAVLSRRGATHQEAWFAIAARYAYAFVPLGVAMWLAHYALHLFGSWQTVIPAAQRFVAELGWEQFGMPVWGCACCQTLAPWITHAQILTLDIGLLGSLYTGLRIAESRVPGLGRAVKEFAPWAALIVLLFGLGVWIVFQPMEMRGTFGENTSPNRLF